MYANTNISMQDKMILIRRHLIDSSIEALSFDILSRLKQTALHQDLQKLVGHNLRRLRRQLNLSQDDFADLAGFHRAYVGAVERGERNITLSTLAQFATALKTTPTALLRKSGTE